MNLVERKSTALRMLPVGILILATTSISCFSSAAFAADHIISSQASSYDCASVKPGDTLTLRAGERGPLTIRKCIGTADRTIRIRNDASGSGPVTIRRTSGGAGGYVFVCKDCIHVEIDGSGKWAGAAEGKTYGIKVTYTGGESPTAFVNISGLSRFVTIRNVEVDGRWPSVANDGIGIAVNDHSLKTADHPGIWREGIVIEHNYVHNVEGEGLYIGPNWRDGDEIPLRNIEIRNNLVEETGWDGINLKSSIAGTNSIHHNIIRRVGRRTDSTSGQHHGITIFEGNGRIYNNWVESVGQVGILHHIGNLPPSYGPQTCEIFNNVVLRTGELRPDLGHGIASGNRDDGAAPPLPKIYNNTVIGAKGTGVSVGKRAVGGFVRDNIVSDSTNALRVPDKVVETNNRIDTPAKIGFVDASGFDFRLRSDSPARNAGGTLYPPTDFLDTSRPKDGTADQGAFEFDNGATGNAKPNPPQLVTVD